MQEFIEYLKNIDTKLFPVLLTFMLLDILTGVVKAFMEKDFQSTKFREGLFKKTLEAVICLVGYLLDYTLNMSYIGNACVLLIIGMEAYSIVVENVSEYIPMPQWLIEIIDKLKAGERKED